VTFSGPGPAALVFRNTDGVRVYRNTQPLEPGGNLAMVATQGSTRVDVRQQPYRKLGRGRSAVVYIVGCLAAAVLFLVMYRRLAR
jgi:hypothetical protein